MRGRLWRASNPHLSPPEQARLIEQLMDARRDLRGMGSDRADARARVDAAKRALGERGPPWWDDGAKDWNRHLAKNTPYAAWWAAQEGGHG